MTTRSEGLLHHLRRLAPPGPENESDAALVAALRPRPRRGSVRHPGPAPRPARPRGLPAGAGNVDVAEDSFQAGVVGAGRKATAVRPGDRLASWLHGVARQVSLNALRGDARRRRREAAAARAGAAHGQADPLDELSAREVLFLLHEEVQRLPEAQRLPVLLCCLEGKTQEEGGAATGLDGGAGQGPSGARPSAAARTPRQPAD